MLGKGLQLGDTIGVVAPAGIENSESIQKGIDKLISLGFKVKIGKHVYKKWGYFAGEDFERAKDIMDMFMDNEVAMIQCVRGGYGAMRLLPYINFRIIRKRPKIFMGYSDITVLLNYINKKTGLITFHGPMLTSNLEDETTLHSFLQTITNSKNGYELENSCNIPLESNSDKTVEGKIVGGNLSLICSTLGTKYEVDLENNILFIEEVGEAPYRIDRMLTQLALSQKLKKCAGILLGQFTDCEDSKSKFSLREVIEDRLLCLNKPVLMNFASGHDYPKLTLPIGAKARLNCKKCTIEVLSSVIK